MVVGTPKCMVYIVENPITMDDLGVSCFQNLHGVHGCLHPHKSID